MAAISSRRNRCPQLWRRAHLSFFHARLQSEIFDEYERRSRLQLEQERLNSLDLAFHDDLCSDPANRSFVIMLGIGAAGENSAIRLGNRLSHETIYFGSGKGFRGRVHERVARVDHGPLTLSIGGPIKSPLFERSKQLRLGVALLDGAAQGIASHGGEDRG